MRKLRRAHEEGGPQEGTPYCKYCTTEDGKLKSYEEVLQGSTMALMEMKKMKPEEAKKVAKENLAKMPAWKERRR